MPGAVILVLDGLRGTEDMLCQQEHPGTDLQMCFVRRGKIYIELKRVLLEREGDNPSVGQKIRSLTDGQDACSSYQIQDPSILFQLGAAYKKDVTSPQFLLCFSAHPTYVDTPTMKGYIPSHLRQRWSERKVSNHANNQRRLVR
jgi:hypothetical protein